MPPQLTEIVQRHAGHIRTAPRGDLAVPVLTDDKRVHALAVHIEMLPKLIFESRTVEHCPGADHPVLRHVAEPARHIGEDVYRIGHNQQYSLVIPGSDLRDDALVDRHILVNQIQPRLVRFLVRPGCDDDDRRIHDVVVAARIDIHMSYERNAVRHVKRLPLRLVVVRIDQYHLRKQSALHQAERSRRPNKTAAHDRHLSIVDHYIFHCLSPPYYPAVQRLI